MEELLNQHIIDPRHSTGDICSRCICFFGNLSVTGLLVVQFCLL